MPAPDEKDRIGQGPRGKSIRPLLDLECGVKASLARHAAC